MECYATNLGLWGKVRNCRIYSSFFPFLCMPICLLFALGPVDQQPIHQFFQPSTSSGPRNQTFMFRAILGLVHIKVNFFKFHASHCFELNTNKKFKLKIIYEGFSFNFICLLSFPPFSCVNKDKSHKQLFRHFGMFIQMVIFQNIFGIQILVQYSNVGPIQFQDTFTFECLTNWSSL